MERQRDQRKLTVILSADVVGFTRLMDADESATLAQLKAHRKELIEPRTAEFGGRVIKLMGDGTLMEFDSVVDAVLFADSIQRAMAARNATVAEDRQIVYRVGVNVGDVIVDGDDIYGDGVNVAVRLQELAAPGGICVSQTVFDHVRNKVDLDFEDLGEREIKNLPDPIRVYGVRSGHGAAAPPAEAVKPDSRSWKWPAAAAVAIVAVAAGVGIWQRPWEAMIEPEGARQPASQLSLPDKPSIAVLPFDNLSDDPTQEYFADGMTEDLITDLSKISGLFVIARNSVFTYKGRAVNVRQIADELGVRYVLEGSVRRVGDDVRINAQLIDTETGGHLWAERYDGSLADVFALQDTVTKKIVSALAVNLTSSEQTLQSRTRFDNPRAYDAFLQGREHFLRATLIEYAQAVPFFEEAIEIDPTYGRPYAALAEIYRDSAVKGWYVGEVPPDEAFWRAEQYLHEAKKTPTPIAHQVASRMLARQGWYDKAIAEAERAIALDANDPDGYIAMAEALIWAGQPARSVEFIDRAMRLDPHYPPDYDFVLGLARFGMRQYEAAALSLERAAKRNPGNYSQLTVLAACYGYLGREEDARSAIAKADSERQSATRPAMTLGVVDAWPYRNGADWQRLRDGLREAGVPELPKGFLARSTDRLGGDEIRSLLFDRTHQGFDPRTGADWMVSIGGNGETMVLAPWFSGSETRWIEGERLCSRQQGTKAGSKSCGYIFRNSAGTSDSRNEFDWVGATGIYPFSVD